MANTITVSAQLSVTFGAGGSLTGASAQQITQSGTHSIDNVQNIGTSAVALTIGSLANAAFIWFKNLDSTNYVEVALDSGISNIISKVLPGGVIIISPETTTIYAKAHTAACDCQIVACEA